MALFTTAAHEALADNAAHCRFQQKRFHPHVAQAAEAADRAVGMQCRKHKVAGQGGLDGDFRSLPVPDLANEDNVRILT